LKESVLSILTLRFTNDFLKGRKHIVNSETCVRIGSELNEVRKMREESTLKPTNTYRLLALDPLTVVLDPRHQNGNDENSVEVGHLDVIVLGIGVLIPNHHVGHIAREDVAILMENLVVRNLVLIFRKENAHVVLVANMNMHVPVVIGVIHPKEHPLPPEEDLLHLGVLDYEEHLFKMLTRCVMLFVMVRHVNGVISVFTLIHCRLQQEHLALDLIRKTTTGRLIARRLSLFVRGGSQP
jgi:hypothetical protein